MVLRTCSRLAGAAAAEDLPGEVRAAVAADLPRLPKELPVLGGWELAAYYQPARAVGGDFYDFIPLPGKRVGLVVGDVSDKGVPAALFMALTYSLLRAQAVRYKSAGEALRSTNRLLYQMNSSGMFVTLVLGAFAPRRVAEFAAPSARALARAFDG